MLEHYIHSLEYNKWANSLIIKSLSENSPANQKVFSIVSHLIIAQILWLNRVKKETYEYRDFWQILSMKELENLSERNTSDWILYLRSQNGKDLQKQYSYVNSKGKAYTNTLAQVITHLINHSTYHKGQIAYLLRAENIAPPLTDYIAFTRYYNPDS